MEETLGKSQDAGSDNPSELTVAVVITPLLKTLASKNQEAASLLQARVDSGSLGDHMTLGEIRALADELVQTCQEVANED